MDFLTKAAILVFNIGFLVPLYGGVNVTCLSTAASCSTPASDIVAFGDCSLPQAAPLKESFTVATSSGTANLIGLEETGKFLVDSLLMVTASGQVTITASSAALSNGVNSAYIGFFFSGSSSYVGFITVDIQCTPQSTIILTVPGDAVAVQANEGSEPGSIVLKSAINAQGSSPVQFTMTPDTPPAVSPWIAFASVPGSPANTGSATPGVPEDLTIGVNPAGLAAQTSPYVGFVHIRDNKTGQGAADLTVQLSVATPNTGNATLPHFAANGVYVTDFYLVNTAAQAANYAIYFYTDSGTAFSMLVQGQGVVNHIAGALPPNGSAFFEAGDPTVGTVSDGSAQVVADPSVGVQAVFRLHQTDSTGSHYYEAAVPATTGSKEFQIPLDFTVFAPTGEQIYTGIAIANLDTVNSSTISCTARDSSGTIIPNAVQVPVLAPNGHWAGYNFPALLGKRGTLDCTGTTIIGAIGLHAFAVSGAISSLPVILK